MSTYLALQPMAYAFALALAFFLNRKDVRMFALTLAVSANILVPIPNYDTPESWYLHCFFNEVLTAIAAALLAARASWFIVALCAVLGVMHITAVFVGPQPGFGPYRLIIPVLEYSMVLVCYLLSEPIFNRITGKTGVHHEQCT
jgi:hypothetical protein